MILGVLRGNPNVPGWLGYVMNHALGFEGLHYIDFGKALQSVIDVGGCEVLP